MNLDAFIMKYAVVLSKRTTLKQRKLVFAAVYEDFTSLGYEVKGITEKRKGRVSLNIHIGDVSNAQTLIIAPYDMPPRRYFSKGYHPFREEDNVLIKLFSENILTLATVALGFTAYALTININAILSYAILGVFTALILVMIFIYPLGMTCRYTANKNNSALAVMLSVAESLQGKNKVAFVLLDHVSLNHHGELMLSTILAKAHAQPTIIYLDCVGVGQVGLISGSQDNQGLAKHFMSCADDRLRFETKTHDKGEVLMSALNRFPKALMISVGNMKGKRWAVPNVRTSRDTELDDTVISAVSDLLLKGLE